MPQNTHAMFSEYKRLCDLFSEVWSVELGLISLTSLEGIYASESFTRLTGISNNAIETEKENIYFRLLHPKELPIIGQAHLKTIQLYNKLYRNFTHIPYVDAKYYIKIKTASGRFENYSALIHPVSYTTSGFPLISFVLLQPGMAFGYERFSISMASKDKKLYFSSLSNKYVPKESLMLKQIESKILELTSKGFGETKIAKVLDIKLDLLRYYKKSIYKKFHVTNMAEAVFIAVNNNSI